MGKKYLTKKIKKRLQEEAELHNEFHGLQSPSKDKKIVKEPRTKDTILSDIELQIVDMFSRSFTNGQIGVKYPQQKKKGMMRLMNFCFRTIIQEVELYIGPGLKKEAITAKSIDKRERTIFYLSSNYRYKHIEKSLLEDFKIVCRNFVKYHCLQHMDVKFLQKFYKKVIFNDFSTGSGDFYKSAKLQHVEPEESNNIMDSLFEGRMGLIKSPKGPTTTKLQMADTTVVKKPGKRGRKRKHPLPEPEPQQQPVITSGQNHQVELTTEGNQQKASKICIEKINIYLGYDTKTPIRSSDISAAKLLTHPYGRMQVEDCEPKPIKRRWTVDMESELIDQFMNSSATSPNIIIRNLMKKFGRNKLFVESQINSKRKEMFKISVQKFIDAFDGKTLCSEEAIAKMENILKNMSLSPKNYFIASFIHDFYFKEVEGISVTLLSEYVHKLSRDELINEKIYGKRDEDDDDDIIEQKKKILERQDLKYALNAMSKIVANYAHD